MRTAYRMIVLLSVFALPFIGAFSFLAALRFPLDVGLFAFIAAAELAFIAVFEERIHAWLRRPELDLEVKLEGPDAHQVPIPGTELGQVSHREIKYPVYFYRMRIWNRGNVSAEKVEVLLTKVYTYQDGKPQLDKSFPIDNLNWSTVGTKSKIFYVEGGILKVRETLEPAVYSDYISPGTYKYCTLGHIWNPERRKEDDYGAPRFTPKEGRSTFCFEVSFKSNIGYYHREEGTYGIEVQVAASNAKTITKKFKIEVTGDWSEDEETMLRKGLKTKQVHYDFEKYVENAVSKEQVSGKSEAGATEKEKPPAETIAGSQQPSASDATPQTTADQDKKEETA